MVGCLRPEFHGENARDHTDDNHLLGGQRDFANMFPLVFSDAVAILFIFDLSRTSALNSVKEWYPQARGFNKVSPDNTRTLRSFADLEMVMKTAIPFLIGTKFDTFATLPRPRGTESIRSRCRITSEHEIESCSDKTISDLTRHFQLALETLGV